ncbi:Hypothetical predicted protein [Paramuricea clavata]|uniref:Uncharacterized protein n=1 Tax=Paramuricea clavata TaxID=317549 RepID=A0A7D9E374_PARCT|nr:Hypothetical predicted protein [Paramuricea clavata]
MKSSIKAIQNHMIRNGNLTLDKQHQYCPRSPDTWCKYWKDKADETHLYNENNPLPEVSMEELDSIFTRLSKDERLSRCLNGMTQKQNEAANGILWSKCPKTKFCGARLVRIAVCETIAMFNTSASSKAAIMELRGVTAGAHTMKAFRKQDDSRLKNAARQVSAKYIERRQKLRSQRKAKGGTGTPTNQVGLMCRQSLLMQRREREHQRRKRQFRTKNNICYANR